MAKLKAVLIGGTGYGGAEILRRLLFHPHVELVRVTAVDNVGKRVGDVHLNLQGLTELVFERVAPKEAVKGADVVKKLFATEADTDIRRVIRTE